MRSRQPGPGQLVFWTLHELTQIYARTDRRGTRRVVPLACPSWRPTTVKDGPSTASRSTPPQVRGLPGRPQDHRLIFQAGHAGSIPVTRSPLVLAGQKGCHPLPATPLAALHNPSVRLACHPPSACLQVAALGVLGQRVRVLLVGSVRVRRRHPHAAVPHPCMSSRVLAPEAAARVFSCAGGRGRWSPHTSARSSPFPDSQLIDSGRHEVHFQE